MATILEFCRPDDTSQAPKADCGSDENTDQAADIIIFPGVRIERQNGDAASQEQPAAASGRQTETVRRD